MMYLFKTVNECNMCQSPSKEHKTLGQRLNKSQGYFPKKKTGISVSVMKCKNCGLVFSNPMPIPQDILDHYNIDPNDFWVEDYFKIDNNYFQNEIDQLKLFTNIQTGMKSLDIGAGIGKGIIALKKEGFDAFGIEPSETFYQMAIERMAIPSDKLSLNSIESADFPNDHFDFITFGAVLEHLHDPSRSINKALSWLKPSGIIHIEVPSSNWLISKILNSYYQITLSNYVTNLSPMHPPYHLYEFDLKSFQLNGVINNYNVTHFNYHVCKTYLPKFADSILKPFMKSTNTGMQLSVWLTRK